MNYRISRRADADIEAVCSRIGKDNPRAAHLMDVRIHQAIQRLAEFPGMGHTRPDVRDERYRFWVVGRFVIVYRLEQNELVVVRVLHGSRDFRKLFETEP